VSSCDDDAVPDPPQDEDPARTLRLLWRLDEGTQRRGPRRRLRLEEVVAAGTSLADNAGGSALTMRRVAAELEVAAMTLYSYVPGRAVLLQLMLDQAYADQPVPPLATRPWRDRVSAVADAHRELFLRHPWAAELSPTRPPLGPGLIAKYERDLAAFDGLGLPDAQRDAALTFVLGFAMANARDVLAARETVRGSGRTDEQWWAGVGPELADVLDPEAFPLAVRVGVAAGAAQGSVYDPDVAYRFGLQRVLDGLATIVVVDSD